MYITVVCTALYMNIIVRMYCSVYVYYSLHVLLKLYIRVSWKFKSVENLYVNHDSSRTYLKSHPTIMLKLCQRLCSFRGHSRGMIAVTLSVVCNLLFASSFGEPLQVCSSAFKEVNKTVYRTEQDSVQDRTRQCHRTEQDSVTGQNK